MPHSDANGMHRRIGRAALLSMALATTACTPDDTTATNAHAQAAAASDATAAGARAGAAPARDALPDCNAIGAILGGAIGGWTQGDDNGFWDNGAGSSYGVSCTWLSPRLQSSNAFEVVQGGSLGMMIVVDPQQGSVDGLRTMGWVIDDAAVESVGGALVFPSGKLDFAAPLAAVGPQVLVGQVTVNAAAVGVLLNHFDEGRGLSNRQAIDAAVAVHRILQQ